MTDTLIVCYIAGVFALGGFGFAGVIQSRVHPWHMVLITLAWPVLVPVLMAVSVKTGGEE